MCTAMTGNARASCHCPAMHALLTPSPRRPRHYPQLSHLDPQLPCPPSPRSPPRPQNDGGLSHALNRIHARTNNPDRALVAAFKEVSTICDHLKVKGGVKDRACEEYKAVVEVRQGCMAKVD